MLFRSFNLQECACFGTKEFCDCSEDFQFFDGSCLPIQRETRSSRKCAEKEIPFDDGCGVIRQCTSEELRDCGLQRCVGMTIHSEECHGKSHDCGREDDLHKKVHRCYPNSEPGKDNVLIFTPRQNGKALVKNQPWKSEFSNNYSPETLRLTNKIVREFEVLKGEMKSAFPDLLVNNVNIQKFGRTEENEIFLELKYIVDFTGEILPEAFQVELKNIIHEKFTRSFRSNSIEIVFNFDDFDFKILDYSDFFRSKLSSIDPSTLPEALSYLLSCEKCSVFQSKPEQEMRIADQKPMMNSIVGSASLCDLCDAKNESLFVQVKK
ncbi:Oidioi.mRNA.OKI2018_I69.chr2.g5255.t1.cds [Oikopleura dioica]|uniref:Oidioi.mRNA.OKI2018_I69.chr2.g5255.t1.cds n=1 Tax=Oikopleura dioica TaxID=34765 RepID=A0ABN7T8Z1_OIKDI|nr:Oidioi.mRNA.OKI2018_I69.chr2.g5255.t1.cds [Oikopleura dioica]